MIEKTDNYKMQNGFSGLYTVKILQYSFDEISIFIQDALSKAEKMIIVPIKKNEEFALKINKMSVSCVDGKAETLLKLLESRTGQAFIRPMIQKIYFDNPKKEKLMAW